MEDSRWRSVWGQDWRTPIVFFILFLMLIPVFFINAAGTSASDAFATWGQESEALVVARVESDRVGPSDQPYGLVLAKPDLYSPYSTVGSPDLDNATTQEYVPYSSQVGLMGYFYSGLHHAAPCSSLGCLHLASSTLFSFTLVLLVFLLGIIARRSFAIIFLLSIVASPWIVTAARNLYWSPWTWLLPVCAAALFVISRKNRWRAASLVMLYLAFAIRFASGYEFVTSFILMAAAIPVLGVLLRGVPNRTRIIKAVKDALVVVAVSLAAFVSVLMVHASLRGAGSVWTGLGIIWREDVERRTYGAAGDFDPIYAASLNAGPFAALQKYVFQWNTNFLVVGSGSPFTISFGPLSFAVLLFLCIVIVGVRFAQHDKDWVKDALILGVTGSIPVSWYVLAKAHSYIHTQINFVLWYLFFAAALLYIIFNFIATRKGLLAIRQRFAHDRAD